MSFAADVLASTLQDLLPGYTDLWTGYHPLSQRIMSNGGFNRRKLKGPWVEFNVLAGDPGEVTPDRNGNAVLASGRKENLKRAKEYGARLVYHFNVPEKDLDECDNEHDFANLVENYGDPAMAGLMERINAQLTRGASTAGTDELGGGVETVVTFNGDQTYDPEDVGTNRQGIFQFAAPASQTHTVHNIAKRGAAGGITGWYNQYDHISSFSAHGRKIMRRTRDRANRQGASLSGGIDLLLGDDGSYQNYAESLDDQVQVAVVENDKGQGKVREGLKFGTAAFFADDHIDITDAVAFTTAVARQGVIYGFCSEDWEMFTVGKRYSGKQPFDVAKPIPLQDTPAFQYRISTYFNMFCKQLRRQMVITGGNNV